MEIRHIFFDLDHTLWDFEANSRQALEQLYEQYKIKEMGIESLSSFIDIYEAENERSWALYRVGKMTKHDLRYNRFFRAFEQQGITKEQSAELGEEYIRISPHNTHLMPGAIEAVEYLKSKDYILHILTNGFEEVQHIKMDKSGLKPYFDEVITSDQIGVKKPDPIAFHKAKELTGLNTEPIAMIGDHLEADVLGAMNVGWKGIYYNPEKEEVKVEIHHELHHLDDLKGIF